MPSAYDKRVQAALREAERRIKEIYVAHDRVRICDLDRFRLSIHATVIELKQFWKERHVKLTTIMSTSVKRVTVMDDQPLPVTAPFSFGPTFHIIVLFDPDHPDGPWLEFLVRETDGYILGWRVKNRLTTNESGGWYVFKDVRDEELPQFLGPYTKTSYNQCYSVLKSVHIGKGVLPACYEYFMEFNDPSSWSTHGLQMKETILVICGEGQRLARIQTFVSDHYTDEVWEGLKQQLIDMIQDWSKLSKAALHLILALLEQAEFPRFYQKTLAEATKLWDAVKANHGWLDLHGPDGISYELTKLVGSELLVLKHDPLLVTKIIMRFQGFSSSFIPGAP